MTTTLVAPWMRPDVADTAPARPPRRVRAPLLIGDILTTRCGEPELLIRWREDRDLAEDD